MAFSELKQIPIADLHPGISAGESLVHGIITLVWPYSSTTSTFSFLLVEPDFRLRRHRGQVRVSLRGSCARRVNRLGLASGDEIRLAVDGTQWQKDDIAASTPGRGIGWELVYAGHIRLERILGDDDVQIIDTSRMGASPEPQSSSILPASTPIPASTRYLTGETPKKESVRNTSTNAWSSPVFLKNRRLPDIFPLKSDLGSFAADDDEEWENPRPAKKAKFGRKSDEWRVVEQSSGSEDDGEIIMEDAQKPIGSSVRDVQADPASSNNLEAANPINIPTITTGVNVAGREHPALKPPQDLKLRSENAGELAANSRDRQSLSLALKVSSQPEQQGSLGLSDAHSNQSSRKHTTDIAGSQARPLLDDALNISDETSVPLADISMLKAGHSPDQPELEPDIRILEATPLVQPVSTDLDPITPRLQPLPSPGLAIVSPIEQRKPPRTGYFSQADAESQQTVDSRADIWSQPGPFPADAQHDGVHHDPAADTGVSFPSANTEVSDKAGQQTDTFFDKLLAHYDQGTVTETGVSDVQDVRHMPTSPIPERDPTSSEDKSSQIHNLQDSSQANDTVEDLQQETFDDKRSDVSEESEEDDSARHGKLRDMTYKPTYEETITHNAEPTSPLMSEQPIPESLSEDIESAGSTPKQQALVNNTGRFIQDTYFVSEELDGSSSPLLERQDDEEDRKDVEVEVVDLLDSDTSASEAEDLPDLQAHLEIPILDEVVESSSHGKDNSDEDDNTPKASLLIEKAKSAPSEHADDENDMDVDSNNHMASETQAQEFFTAPIQIIESSDAEADDLVSIAEDVDVVETDEHTTEAMSEQSATDNSAQREQPSSKAEQSAEQLSDLAEQSTTSHKPNHFGSIDAEKDADDPSVSSSAQDMATGFRTTHEYYSTLGTIHEFFNNTTSLLAVVVASSKPIRATTGPRDYNQTLYLSSPHSKAHSDFTIAQLFRPHSAALPHPIIPGDVILLKDFKVQSYQRRMSLLSTETSAWVVFEHVSATNQSNMTVSNPGPPVEFGAAERGVAWGLGKWWMTLDDSIKESLTSAASTARDKAQAELERKATAANKKRSKGSSQTKPQTPPRRQTRSQAPAASIPNTPSTTSPTHRRTRSAQAPISPVAASPATHSPTHRRTRSTQQASHSLSPTPTPTKPRFNLRSSPVIPESQETTTGHNDHGNGNDNSAIAVTEGESEGLEHELRSGLVYSDNESDLAEIPGRSLVDENAASTKTTGEGRKTGKKASRTGSSTVAVAAAGGRKTRSQAKAKDVDVESQVAEGQSQSQSQSQSQRGGRKGKGKAAAAAPGWHELRDGAVYKD